MGQPDGQERGGGLSLLGFLTGAAHLHSGKQSPYKDTTILATAYEDPKHMKGLGVGWDEQIHFIRSDDFFASAHTKLASCGNQFEIAGDKVRPGRMNVGRRVWAKTEQPLQLLCLSQTA